MPCSNFTNLFSQEVLAEISVVAGVLDSKGWAEGGGGNISVRLAEFASPSESSNSASCPERIRQLDGSSFAFTLSGSRMREVAVSPAEHLGIVSVENGRLEEYAPAERRISSELLTHLYAYAANGCSAIVHAHAEYSSVLSRLFEGRDVPRMLGRVHTEMPIVLERGVSVVGQHEPGSKQLAGAVGDALSGSDAVLLERHGLIAGGSDLMQALDRFEVAEKCSRMLYIEKLAGLDADS
ncbi:MAG: class II aldolase/adducin family protein [Planctomycetota bacterium]|nr:class II aldolase/adducin family protein [Planctomycetota bacterium]